MLYNIIEKERDILIEVLISSFPWMNPLYDVIERRDRLKSCISKILKDEESAVGIVGRQSFKVPELKERFGKGERQLALVSFDVDKIKDIVFSSSKPLEVFGASEMVREFTDEESKDSIYSILRDFGLDKESIIFAGGGTGLLLVPASSAEKLTKEISKKFSEFTITGSCTSVFHKFYPHELIIGPESPQFIEDNLPSLESEGITWLKGKGPDVVSFGSIVQFLADIIRKKKDMRFEFSIPFLSGYLMRCQSCGVLPASEVDIPRQSEKICNVCMRKRNKGRDKRESMPEEMMPAQTIEDIAGMEEGKMGYVAVIYADANNMGKMLFEMNSMLEFAVFSMTVTEVMEKVTKDLVKEYRLSGKYQAPILGGDDILLLVPANRAPSIVSSLAKKVEDEMKKRGGSSGGELGNKLKNIKMSVGFVIVPSNFAIAFSVEYAEKLLRTAKEKSYEESNQPCVDYMVVKDSSPLGLDIKEFRDAVYDWEPDGAKVKLTQKPYLLKDFRNMMRWVKFLRQAKVARSQLKIAESLLKSEPPRVARLNILYEWIRSKEWRDFFKNIRCDDPKQWLDKFVLHEKHPKIYESRFLDFLELYEYEEG